MDNILTVTLPHSAVLFLRSNVSAPDKMKIRMVTPGGNIEYEAKTIKREGIEGTVSILKNLGVPTQTILSNIQEQYHLSPEASKKYLSKYIILTAPYLTERRLHHDKSILRATCPA